MYSPAIMVHGLAHARAALLPGRKVTLLSGPGAGIYAGAGWWRAVMDAAAQAHPGQNFAHILDCGDAPGRALEALRHGQSLIVLARGQDRQADIWADIAARAAEQGATLLAVPPPALDMARPDAVRRLLAWLTDQAPE